jgi:hypothetical protein
LSSSIKQLRELFEVRILHFFRRRRPESARNLSARTLQWVSTNLGPTNADGPELGWTILNAARQLAHAAAERDGDVQERPKELSLSGLEPHDRLLLVDYLTGDRSKIADQHEISGDDLRQRVIWTVRKIYPAYSD